MTIFDKMLYELEDRQRRDGGTFLEAVEAANREAEAALEVVGAADVPLATMPLQPHDPIPTSMSFDVRRGYFQVDAETVRDESRLAYAIASQTPEGAKLTSEPMPGGGRRFTWRIIRIVPHYDGAS